MHRIRIFLACESLFKIMGSPVLYKELGYKYLSFLQLKSQSLVLNLRACGWSVFTYFANNIRFYKENKLYYTSVHQLLCYISKTTAAAAGPKAGTQRLKCPLLACTVK